MSSSLQPVRPLIFCLSMCLALISCHSVSCNDAQVILSGFLSVFFPPQRQLKPSCTDSGLVARQLFLSREGDPLCHQQAESITASCSGIHPPFTSSLSLCCPRIWAENLLSGDLLLTLDLAHIRNEKCFILHSCSFYYSEIHPMWANGYISNCSFITKPGF